MSDREQPDLSDREHVEEVVNNYVNSVLQDDAYSEDFKQAAIDAGDELLEQLPEE